MSRSSSEDREEEGELRLGDIRDREFVASLRQRVASLEGSVTALRAALTEQVSTDTLFVNGVPPTASDPDVHSAFARLARVRNVRLLRSPGGTLKGSGFIQFETPADMVDALATSPLPEIHGRRVRVHVANSGGRRAPPTAAGPEKRRRSPPPTRPSSGVRAYWSNGEAPSGIRADRPRSPPARHHKQYGNSLFT